MTEPATHPESAPRPDPDEVKALFLAMLEGEESSDASTAIASAAPEVQAAARALLDAHNRAVGLLDAPPASGTASGTAGGTKLPITPPEIPGYEIGEELGRGGFGVVFRAKQLKPVERDVAVKILRAELATPETAARFRAESALLARMNHEGIARVLDAGQDHIGRPFVAMEFIDGVTLTEYCESNALSVRDRVELLAKICDAVHHAHQRAVIHRDLKPANLLIEEVDAKPRPRVIDFGIAKILGDTVNPVATIEGLRLGTPRYMSPEQRSGEETSDLRIDVFTLGVLLCEVLTGEVPHQPRSTVANAGSGSSGRLTKSTTRRRSRATKPSQLVADAAPVVAARARELKGDLDRIVLKAAADDPALRYPSAFALGQDLRRYLKGLPVDAAPPSPGYLLSKFVMRHRGATVAAAVALMSLGAGAAALVHGFDEAKRGRDIAEQALGDTEVALARSEAVVTFLLGDMLDVLGPTSSAVYEPSMRDYLRQAADKAEDRLAETPDVLIDVLDRVGAALHVLSGSEGGWQPTSRAAQLARDEYGPDHPETIRLDYLAAVRKRATDHSEGARDAVFAARDKAIEVLGPEHPTSLRARTSALLITIGDPREEMEQIEATYRRLGLVGSEGHLELLQGMGLTYKGFKAPNTIDHMRDSVRVAEDAVGPAHSSTMMLRQVFLRTLIDGRRFDEAHQVLERQLQLAEPIFGAVSIYRGFALQSGTLLANLEGDTESQRRFAAQYLDAMGEVYGNDSVQYTTAGHHLARAQFVNKHYADAVETYAWVVPRRASEWGESAASVLADRGFWARCLIEIDRPSDAAAVLAPIFDLSPPEGRLHAEGTMLAARIAEESGDLDAAITLVAQALERTEDDTAKARLEEWLADRNAD